MYNMIVVFYAYRAGAITPVSENPISKARRRIISWDDRRGDEHETIVYHQISKDG